MLDIVATYPAVDDPDPRARVEIEEENATLTLFFDRERAWAGDAALLEVRLTPAKSGEFRPWRLMPRLPHHLSYARAWFARERGDIVAALKALREHNAPRRGISDAFLDGIARYYRQLVAEGEPYPITAMANAFPTDKSTASRWVSAARNRGFLGTE